MRRFSPWPFAVVFLLTANAGLAFFALYMSRSDGGAQVVDNYYARAVAWDSLAAAQVETAETGWKLRVVDADADGALRFRVTTRDDAPVVGLTGEITVSRPQISGIIGSYTIGKPGESAPGGSDASGAFSVALALSDPGLYDVVADLTDGSVRFRPRIRFERHAGTR